MAGLRSFFNWQIGLLVILLVAIVFYFLIGMASFQPIHAIPAKDIPLLIGIIICGVPLIFQILFKLFKRDLGADSLAALAVITAVYLGEYLAGTIVLLMIASGEILETYAIGKASSVLEALAKRMPSIAHRKQKQSIEEISIDKIQVGDYIVVYPHETCPVDGIVVEGHGSMDESYLTGEPYFVSKAPGVSVISGAINGESLFVIQATQLPQDSRYAKIMKVMEESQQKRPKLRRLSDQLGAVFAPFALISALLAWYVSDEPVRFLAVLVIATPCPLLIGIPIAIISAISLSAKRGIIIKDPVVLERLPTCKTAIFDKTGTLTYGRAELEEIVSLPAFKNDHLLQKTASLERFSKHPLAEAVLKAAEKSGLTLLNVKRVSENPGQGLLGTINGKTIQIISRKTLTREYPDQVPYLPSPKPGMESIILINNKLAGVFRFRDTLRHEGFSFISHLAPIHQFTKIMIVSGDRLSEVEYLAKKLGIKEIYAGQTPEQKVEIVRQEASKAPTLFMGDGINDAPALAAATVGIAFGHQNIVTTEAAGAVILESSLAKVDEFIHISALMRQTALITAGGGMLLSVIGMYFAGIGMIQPVAGALLQEGIDVLAILYALKLTWQSKIHVDIKD
ncbi:MAG: metal-transporting ATPase [Alphaproteobacteria bacterium 41-28]|nr:MAG: metal-transporting ATPase [Alphaproteobacteria bacterium 41-28]